MTRAFPSFFLSSAAMRETVHAQEHSYSDATGSRFHSPDSPTLSLTTPDEE